MTFLNIIIYFFIIPLCILKFILNFNHLLVRLITLELIALSFFFGLRINLQFMALDSVFLLYFLVIMVCEGVLGLSILILIRFSYGVDYLFNFNKLLC